MEDRIKEIILSNGADVCGVANIRDFREVPEGFSSLDIWQDCQSVIAFGVALPKGLTRVESRLVYSRFNEMSCMLLDEIALKSANEIEKEMNCMVVPMPSDSPYEYWDEANKIGKGLLSMKHTAVICGIGTLGKSNLLLNPKYGNLLNLGVLLTDLDLKTDVPCEKICIENCFKCVEGCPVHAIEEENVIQKLCRKNTYGKTKRGFDTVDCNQCRVVCPMIFGKKG